MTKPMHDMIPMLISLVVMVCLFGAPASADELDRNVRYDTPVRSDAELAEVLGAACHIAVAGHQPLLLEFSAPWCSDCLELHRMKQDPKLSAELDRWPVVVINVGEFDQHPGLLEAFEVRSIARWAVIEPKDCRLPVDEWPRVAQRTLEPDSGNERQVSPVELAKWLEDFRMRTGAQALFLSPSATPSRSLLPSPSVSPSVWPPERRGTRSTKRMFR